MFDRGDFDNLPNKGTKIWGWIIIIIVFISLIIEWWPK